MPGRKLLPPFSPRTALCLLLASIICGLPASHAEIAYSPESHWHGREVFREKGCSQCHAINGTGGQGGTDLGKDRFYGTYLELAALMWNHLPDMIDRMRSQAFQYPELSVQETTDLIAFVSSLRYWGDRGSEFRGRKLLGSKRCRSCHRIGGEGGGTGPDLSAEGILMTPLSLVEAMWNHGPDMMPAFKERKIERPKLKGNDLADLAAALSAQLPPTATVPVEYSRPGDPNLGHALFREKSCIRCHAVGVEGGDRGPALADMDLDCTVTTIASRMWNHGPEMWEAMPAEQIPFPVFRQLEMAHIVAYLYWSKLEDPPGNVERGRELVARKNCLSCHSLRDAGAGSSADLAAVADLASPLEMITAMFNHAPAMQEKRRAGHVKWPELSGRDMADLFAYLNHFSAPAGIE